MALKGKIIDALMDGEMTGPEIAKTLGVSFGYVCRIARAIKCRPKSCTMGRPTKQSLQRNRRRA